MQNTLRERVLMISLPWGSEEEEEGSCSQTQNRYEDLASVDRIAEHHDGKCHDDRQG